MCTCACAFADVRVGREGETGESCACLCTPVGWTCWTEGAFTMEKCSYVSRACLISATKRLLKLPKLELYFLVYNIQHPTHNMKNKSYKTQWGGSKRQKTRAEFPWVGEGGEWSFLFYLLGDRFFSRSHCGRNLKFNSIFLRPQHGNPTLF